MFDILFIFLIISNEGFLICNIEILKEEEEIRVCVEDNVVKLKVDFGDSVGSKVEIFKNFIELEKNKLV